MENSTFGNWLRTENSFGVKGVDVVSGGFKVAGGLASAWSGYNQAKSNYRTAIHNAQQLRQYADEQVADMRLSQWLREGSNVTKIGVSGFAMDSFSDLLRDDYLQNEKAARNLRDQYYAQAAEMERQAKKAKKKAKRSGITKGVLGVASIAAAPFTGGASLAIGGAAMGAFGNYL